MKAYRGRRSIAHLILTLGTVAGELLTAHFGSFLTENNILYTLNRFDGPQRQFGRFKKEKCVSPNIVQP